jgi:hypothetical protein
MCPQRHAVATGDTHDLLDLLDAVGHQHGRGGELVGARVLEGVTEQLQILLAGQHPRAPEGRGELLQRSRERLLRQRVRQRRAHPFLPDDRGPAIAALDCTGAAKSSGMGAPERGSGRAWRSRGAQPVSASACSRITLAIGAAVVPPAPSWGSSTATTTRGWISGAKATNHASVSAGLLSKVGQLVAPVAPLAPVGALAPLDPLGPLGPAGPLSPLEPVGAPAPPELPAPLAPLAPLTPLEPFGAGAPPGALAPPEAFLRVASRGAFVLVVPVVPAALVAPVVPVVPLTPVAHPAGVATCAVPVFPATATPGICAATPVP